MGQSMRGLFTHALPLERRISGIKNLRQAAGVTTLSSVDHGNQDIKR